MSPADLLEQVKAALTDEAMDAADRAYQDADGFDAECAAEGIENDSPQPQVAMRASILSAISPLLSASEARRARLEEALKAAAQFLSPEVSRGPSVNGWQNTVEMVRAALTAGGPQPSAAPVPSPATHLGQAWVTRITSEGGESPSVQGAGVIEKPDELVRFALGLAVATLDEEGCNCHPEEPCALCICREAIIQLDECAARPPLQEQAEPPTVQQFLSTREFENGVDADRFTRHVIRQAISDFVHTHKAFPEVVRIQPLLKLPPEPSSPLASSDTENGVVQSERAGVGSTKRVPDQSAD